MKKINLLLICLSFCVLLVQHANVNAASASPQGYFLDHPPQSTATQQGTTVSESASSMQKPQPYTNDVQLQPQYVPSPSQQPTYASPQQPNSPPQPVMQPTIPLQYYVNQPSITENMSVPVSTPVMQADSNPEQGLSPSNPYYDACPPCDEPCGDCYCLYCHYRPCYYYSTNCEYVPDYCYQRCCRYVQEKYCETRCRTVPQYYNETKCRLVPQYYTEPCCQYFECYNEETCCYETIPQYYEKECCTYVPEEYEVTHCREVPEYYEEECCRYVPQYYYICHCRYCPKYTYQKHCEYVPQYYYKRSGCCTPSDMFAAPCCAPTTTPCR